MSITLFELATQNGIITGHMGQYLKRQIHSYDIPVINGRRTYRVYLGEREHPIFEYQIPDRSTIETQQMWAYKVKAELDKAWKESRHPAPPKLEALAATTPPAAPESPKAIIPDKPAEPKRAKKKAKA